MSKIVRPKITSICHHPDYSLPYYKVTNANIPHTWYVSGGVQKITVDSIKGNPGRTINYINLNYSKTSDGEKWENCPLYSFATQYQLGSEIYGNVSKPFIRFKCGNIWLALMAYMPTVGNRYNYTLTLVSSNDNSSNLISGSGRQLIIQDATLRSANEGYYCTPFIAEFNGELYICNARIRYLATSSSKTYGANAFGVSVKSLETYGEIDFDVFDDEFGSISTEGGYGIGNFDDSSDVIGVPDKPILSVSSMGFVNVYKPSVGSLSGMVDELFPQIDIPNLPTGEGITDIINSINAMTESILNGIIQFSNKNLLDYVLDAHIIPVTPAIDITAPIKVGYKTLSIEAPKVAEDYVDFDCGTLNLKEYYNNYIDYTACNISLYLPFVGFVPLLPEHCLNGSLKVVYRFNILDGSFCAWVLSTSSKSKLTNSIIGSFSGNCCVHIPISATNYSNVISGLVGGVSGMLNAIPSKDNANIRGAVDSVSEIVQSLKPDIALSNGYNATSSYSGIRYPYVIIRRQVASFSENYAKENGLPLNVSNKLSSFSGLTFASEIILDGISATENEKQMIKNLFKEGVIL